MEARAGSASSTEIAQGPFRSDGLAPRGGRRSDRRIMVVIVAAVSRVTVAGACHHSGSLASAPFLECALLGAVAAISRPTTAPHAPAMNAAG